MGGFSRGSPRIALYDAARNGMSKLLLGALM
jgi:hypothetical protein